MGRSKKTIFPVLVVFILFVIASIVITYPLIFHLGDFTTNYGDELVIAWIHSWVINNFFTNPFTLFNANIYYPYHNSLAFSDVFITGSLITAPFVYFIGQPIVANNVTIISSLIFLGFSIFLLTFHITKNYLSSVLSGLLIIFSPATLSNVVQIQMLEIYWVPLAILFFLLFLKNNKTRFIIYFSFCFVLQFYNSFLPAYFILFSVFIIFLFKFLEKKKKITIYFSKKNSLVLVCAFIIMLPIVIPYYQVSKEFHYTRDIRDSIHFALQPEDFLYPGANTKLAPILIQYIPTNHYSQNNEFKPGYLGLIFSFLVLVALVYLIKNRKTLTFYEKSFITIAVTGLLLSFGPLLHLFRQTIHHPFPIPLPYLLFYYILPGFQGFRNSQRWEVLFIISIAVVIGLVLNSFLKNVASEKKFLIYFFLIVGIIIEFAPIHFITIPQKNNFPKIYSWMATTPKNATFIILPIYNWNMQPNVSQELLREYYSTIELHPMVNGYSGFSPPPWQDFTYFMYKKFPKQQSISALEKLDVEYIIIDKATFDNEHKIHPNYPSGRAILAELKNSRKVVLVKHIDNFSVFAITKNK